MSICIAFLSDVSTFGDVTASTSNNPGRELRKRRIVGAVLLTIAILAIVHRYVPFEVDHLILPLIGSGFVIWAIVGRVWGLLIPGCIISGVGFGQWLQRSAQNGVWSGHGQALFLYCMAGGFVLITILSSVVFRRRELWPLWPAFFIAFTGLLRDGVDLSEYFRRVQPFWPFALLVVAVWLLATHPKSGDKS
jgi:hypothetical protein